MKITKYLDSVTRREGKRVSVNRAQIGEIARLLNEDSEGIFFDLIKADVFIPESSPDTVDRNAAVETIKAAARRL